MVYGTFFYFLHLFPVSGVTYVPFMKYSFVADHWAYIGLTGIALIFSTVFYAFMNLIKKWKIIYKVSPLIMTAILCAYIFQSKSYAEIFSKKPLSYHHTAKHNPAATMPQLMLALHYYHQQEWRKSIAILNEALKTQPENLSYYSLLYLIFKQSFFHLIEGKDLFILYPQEHWDLYKYSPTFSLLMAPLAILPDVVGLFFWK